MARAGCPTPDFTRPNGARVYGYFLGGTDNFPADREMARDLSRTDPGIRELARQNRRFILAAVTRVTSGGIGQVLDLGCGMPSVPMVHEAAEPGTRVAYADCDQLAVSHVAETLDRAGLAGVHAAVLADAADPRSVTACPAVREVIDFHAPVLVLLGGVLSAMDAGTARDAVAGWAAAVVRGSRFAISCVCYADEALGRRMGALYSAAGPWHSHSRDDVASFFAAGGLVPEEGAGDLPADLRRSLRACPDVPGAARAARAAVIGGIGVRD